MSVASATVVVQCYLIPLAWFIRLMSKAPSNASPSYFANCDEINLFLSLILPSSWELDTLKSGEQKKEFGSADQMRKETETLAVQRRDYFASIKLFYCLTSPPLEAFQVLIPLYSPTHK